MGRIPAHLAVPLDPATFHPRALIASPPSRGRCPLQSRHSGSWSSSFAALASVRVFPPPSESSIGDVHMLCNTPHPQHRYGSIRLRILRKLSFPRASSSSCHLQGESSPGRPQNFSMVGGARSGCYEVPPPRRRALLAPSGAAVTCLSAILPSTREQLCVNPASPSSIWNRIPAVNAA
jgi:hypothetical protein